MDITDVTQAVAIITPNKKNLDTIAAPNPLPVLPGFQLSKTIEDWAHWPEWRVSVDYLEALTGQDFLSNLPDDIERIIEQDSTSTLIKPLRSNKLRSNKLRSNKRVPLLAAPKATFPSGNISFSAGVVAGMDTAISKDRFVGIPSKFNGVGIDGSFEVSSNKVAFDHVDVFEVSPSKVNISEVGRAATSPFQVSISENSPIQIGSVQQSFSQNSAFQIDPFQINAHQMDTAQINAPEISFSSLVALQQLITGHNSDSQNAFASLWTEFTGGENLPSITFEVRALPKGQLAEAQITRFDTYNNPTCRHYHYRCC